MENDQDHEALQPQLKRQRTSESATQEQPSTAVTPIDDIDEFYDTTDITANLQHQIQPKDVSVVEGTPHPAQQTLHSGIPGLALLHNNPQVPLEHTNGTKEADGSNTEGQFLVENASQSQKTMSITEGVHLERIPEQAVKDHNEKAEQKALLAKKLETETGSNHNSLPTERNPLNEKVETGSAGSESSHKVMNDNNEYEFTSSSADSDSSSDSSGSSDDDEEEYPLMSAEEQVKILMREEAGEDNDVSKSKIVRTEHEIVDEQVKKPDVVVTNDMNVIQLGRVESIVENVILIKTNQSGDYQVLETGSVLCLDDRNVIGAVSETLGRVQEPLYSVAFSRKAEISELGIDIGTIIYYVEDHSTYVFTQSLKATKGTDASNQHDEEPNPDEMEFSDDEAEAEYKRNLKRDRKMKRDQRSTVQHQGNSASTSVGPMNYDDGDVDDDLYEPLARPANLHEMMQNNRAPREEQRQRRPSERRRGARGRPNRGNFNQGRNTYRHSGERNLHLPSNQYPHLYQQRQTSAPEPYSPEEPLLESGLMQQRNETMRGAAEQASSTNIPAAPPFYSNPAHDSRQAVHYSANWPPVAASPISPSTGLPAGAHVNPAFFANNQAPQGAWQQPYQQQPMWSPPPQGFQHPAAWNPAQNLQNTFMQTPSSMEGRQNSPESDLAFRAAQERLEILRRLSGGGATSP